MLTCELLNDSWFVYWGFSKAPQQITEHHHEQAYALWATWIIDPEIHTAFTTTAWYVVTLSYYFWYQNVMWDAHWISEFYCVHVQQLCEKFFYEESKTERHG
jgi:hypothetical protein